jgi:hypothetical protein
MKRPFPFLLVLGAALCLGATIATKEHSWAAASMILLAIAGHEHTKP